MAIKKLPNGKFKLDIYVDGPERRRVREKFDTKGEALRRQAYIQEQAALKLPWNSHNEQRNLQDILDYWFKSYGSSIPSGKGTYARLSDACKEMGNPKAIEFNNSVFDKWRSYRLNRPATKNKKPNKPQTLNGIQRKFVAVFNRIKSVGQWKHEIPLSGLMKLKEKKPTPGFLNDDDVERLLSALEASKNMDLLLVAETCLRTGARWSEAEGLLGRQVFSGNPPRVIFTETKGDEDRLVPISQEFYEKLPKVKAGERLFKDCYSHFRSIFKRMEFDLPKGQLSHVLRHTFASRFMERHGNIKVLQKILGHKEIEMTMRYVHFTPDYLTTAIDLNPVSHRDTQTHLIN